MRLSTKSLTAGGLLLAIALIAGSTMATFGQPADPKPPAPRERKPPTLDSDLSAIMGWAGANWKKVGANNKANKLSPADADSVVQVELAMVLAKTKPAPKAETMTGDAKDKHQLAYRTSLGKQVTKLQELENALLAGKNDDATKLVADVTKIMSDSHKEFMPDKQ